MFLGYLPYHLVGDTRAYSEACQVNLLHFSAAAHIVHQKEGLSFAANESHDLTLRLPF
jgi:hypothetical protein